VPAFGAIAEIENKINHDVKAVEYFLKNGIYEKEDTDFLIILVCGVI